MRLEDSTWVAKGDVDEILLGNRLDDVGPWQDYHRIGVIQGQHLIAVLVTYVLCNEVTVG